MIVDLFFLDGKVVVIMGVIRGIGRLMVIVLVEVGLDIVFL